MKEQVTLHVADIIGSQLCISAEDGQKVFEKIVVLLRQGKQVTMIISLFLNAAIGQLYNEFNEDELKSGLTVSGLADDDLAMLKRVLDNARRYYANPRSFDQAWRSEVEDEVIDER